MNNRFITRIFIPIKINKKSRVRSEIKTRLLESYYDISTREEKVMIDGSILFFQHGLENDIEKLPYPPIEYNYKFEKYITSFEGIHSKKLFRTLWEFIPVQCEISLIGAIQYRIKHRDQVEYHIDIGEICGEESLRLIRISEYDYHAKNIHITK